MYNPGQRDGEEGEGRGGVDEGRAHTHKKEEVRDGGIKSQE